MHGPAFNLNIKQIIADIIKMQLSPQSVEDPRRGHYVN